MKDINWAYWSLVHGKQPERHSSYYRRFGQRSVTINYDTRTVCVRRPSGKGRSGAYERIRKKVSDASIKRVERIITGGFHE